MRRIEKVPLKFRKEVGRQLRDLSSLIQIRRKALKLSQEKLAETLDVSVETVKTIEQSRRYPSLPMLFYICHFLNVKVRFEFVEHLHRHKS
jgi:transcriptional regulator with XRE-family HTH domain